jgi:hypothetical protein
MGGMGGLTRVALRRFCAERRGREWFLIDREGRPLALLMRRGATQARDVARLLNDELDESPGLP